MIVRHVSLAALAFVLSLTAGIPAAIANAFEPPPERHAPLSTAGGGSRPAAASSCTLDESLGLRSMAMSPQAFVGLTGQSTPGLFLYVPTIEAQTIELSVFDQRLNGLSQFEIAAPQAPGFVEIDLSQHIALSADTPYYWTAAFVCNPNRRTEDWVVGGWIRHQPVTDGEQRLLQTLLPLEQVERYTSTGYWYDALTIMLPLVQENPASPALEAMWNRLVQQAALELTWADLGNAIHISKQSR